MCDVYTNCNQRLKSREIARPRTSSERWRNCRMVVTYAPRPTIEELERRGYAPGPEQQGDAALVAGALHGTGDEASRSSRWGSVVDACRGKGPAERGGVCQIHAIGVFRGVDCNADPAMDMRAADSHSKRLHHHCARLPLRLR